VAAEAEASAAKVADMVVEAIAAVEAMAEVTVARVEATVAEDTSKAVSRIAPAYSYVC
jgi:hypothetical protein